MQNVVDKVLSQGNENIILTERGTSFGYQNLVFDVRSIPIMKKLGFPVCIDASHSVQKPGAAGDRPPAETANLFPISLRPGSAQERMEYFWRSMTDPEKARSDAPNSLNIKRLGGIFGIFDKNSPSCGQAGDAKLQNWETIMKKEDIIRLGKEVLDIESEAVKALAGQPG